jgi:uncharacterized membrane protein YdjX (TVP38/TMEM64 family)
MQLRRLGILLLLVGLLVGAAALDPVHAALGRVLASAERVIRDHEALGLALFALLSAVSAVVFFFSSALLVPVAIYSWGKPATILLLWGSWLVGAVVSYLIGRRPGRRLARWLVPERRLAIYERAISARSNFRLVLLFQLAVPSEVPGYLLGAVRYHFGKYLGARAVAEAPFAVGSVLLGDTFVNREYGLLAAVAFAGVLISGVALYLLHKRASRMDPEPPD